MSAKLPHALLDGVLLVRAEEYAGSLYPGATVDASDWRYLDGTPWGKFFGKALAARGLQLSGGVVTKREETDHG